MVTLVNAFKIKLFVSISCALISESAKSNLDYDA